MIKETFKKYADIKNQIKELENSLSPLKEELISSMSDDNADTVETDFGKFVLSKRRVWKYPETVVELKNKFKKAEKESQQIGTATFTETSMLSYYEPE